MNRKTVLLTLTLCTAMLATGCGSKKSSDYSKYLELSDYKTLTVDRVVTTITDEDVQEEVQNNLALSADYIEISDRAAKNGDDIIIDLSTTVDGENLEDLSFEDIELELGSEMIIDGFDSEIIGMKTGENKQFTLTFPTPYDGELDGKDATFDVTVKTIYEIVIPEYTDEYVEEITDSEFLTISDYEAALKATLQETATEDAQNMACENALLTIIENSSFNGYPQELFDSTKKSVEAENQAFAEALGLDDISELYGDDFDLDGYTTEVVNEKMVVYTIAAKEKLTITDEEYNDALSEEFLESDYESMEEMKKDIDEESYKYNLIYQKVLNFLGENCTFNDVDSDEYYAENEDLLFEDEGIDAAEDIGAADIDIIEEADTDMEETTAE